MARRMIDPAVKAAIVVEAQVEGAKLPSIAAKYQVSLPSIYNWLNASKVVAAVSETVEA